MSSMAPTNRIHKYWHYALVGSVLVLSVSALALVNAYLHLYSTPSYSGISPALLVAGYTSMFLAIFASPIPDYFLVPIYGYLSSIGLFNPVATFLICMVASVLPIPYLAGRLAGRPLLLRGLSYFHIREKDVKAADDWLIEHGPFSIFISTFIPFFYTVASLGAGTLKMNALRFMVLSVAGFGIRFAFLMYIGYSSIEIFTSTFDYSQRALFLLLLAASASYVVGYMGWRMAGRFSWTHRQFVQSGST
jgi:membrane protein DedA with SNARE-associated domain